jgi:fructuronate reductase
MAWIDEHVAFPSTMVDRITPAPTDKTLSDAATWTGCDDQAAVETEAFSQWIIEEAFSSGRPAWEAGGAVFVNDVAPYERMKLRLVNGTHSMLAYAGFLSGCRHVRDVMADPALTALVERHIKAATATLGSISGVDFVSYGQSLMTRFANPAISHETYQIAMDGTEKLPQRILEPAVYALEHGQPLRPFAFAIAAWMRYCLGRRDDGKTYALRDPRESEIEANIASIDMRDVPKVLQSLPGFFPSPLLKSQAWLDAVETTFDMMIEHGLADATRRELNAG